jgi:hypothetical protein
VGDLREKIEAEGGKVLHEGRTLRGVEAQVFRLALRAKQQRDAQSAAMFAQDVAPLELPPRQVAKVQDTPDGGIVLTFAPEAPKE